MTADRMIHEEPFNCLEDNVAYMPGFVFSTGSKDFPHVVFSGRRSPLYLFPQSMYFVDNRDFSKAQTEKMSKVLSSGEAIEFKANCDGIIVDYYRTHSTRPLSYRGSDLTNTQLRAYGVFSPSLPRKCWTDFLGLISTKDCLLRFAPNLTYEVYVAFDAYLTEQEDGSSLPKPCVNFELGYVHKVASLDNDVVKDAPWNKRPIQLPEDQDRSQLPQAEYTSQRLYIVDNNEVVWPGNPRYKVVIAIPSTSSVKKTMQEGRAVNAHLFYSEFNDCYAAYDYQVIREEKCKPLEIKQSVAGVDSFLEYRVVLSYSEYAGFFVCEELRHCLIEDSKQILAHVSMDRGRSSFPAFIRLNSFEKVAKFVVSSLDVQNYSQKEIIPYVPDLTGSAFLVNNRTGFLFSPEYPLERVILMFPDRILVEIGEWLTFKATYKAERDVFVVLQYSPIKSRCALKAIPWRDGFLFEETLDSTNLRASKKVYAGRNFGLVTDSEDLVKDKAKKEKVSLPKYIDVMVEYNADRYRSTAFNVYAFSLNPKEIEAEAPLSFATAERWWKSDDPFKCKCRESTEISKEIINIAVDQNAPSACNGLAEELVKWTRY